MAANEPNGGLTKRAGFWADAALGRVEVLALFPLVALTAWLFGFNDLAMVSAFGLSALLAVAAVTGRRGLPSDQATAGPEVGRPALTAMLARIAALDGRDTVCLLLQIDDWPVLTDRWGHDTCKELATRTEDRLRAALRSGDLLVRLGDARFGIGLAPMTAARLGQREAIAARLAHSVTDPIPLNGTTLRLTASLGHTALIRRSADAAGATFLAAEAALSDAMAHGPGAIRAFAPNLGRARTLQTTLSAEVEGAIHDGDIAPWFQPQICARTDTVLGMDTIARWQHPKHGLLGRREFDDAVAASGRQALLGQTMTHRALKALATWDAAHARVPSITVPASAIELRDPGYASYVAAEADRFGITPDRVRIGIAEDVALKSDDDTIIAALLALKAAGHRIDLDGFGTGVANLPVLQRFEVDRIEISRKFVLGVDGDAANGAAVAALVSMASALGIGTLANGVDTPQERERLAELGCDALQGFGIAKPMQAERVADWVRARAAKGKTIRLDDRRNG